MKIVYIHGIGKQLPPRKLKNVWDQALFGKPVENTTMAYWADIMHPELLSEEEDAFRRSLKASDDVLDQTTKTFTEAFLEDVHAYMYDNPQGSRQDIQERLLKELRGEEQVVLVSHSLGTVIAFDILSTVDWDLKVPMFVTIGSPLGIDFLQANLRKHLQTDVLSKPWCVRKWYNFSDPLDVVAADKSVADEFRGGGIRDFIINNPDRLSTKGYGPHSISGYLTVPEVKDAVVAGMRTSNPIYRFFYNLIG